MKKFFLTIIVLALMIIPVGLLEGSFHNYTIKNCEVIRITNDTVDFIDPRNNNIYSFYGDGFVVGDKINVKWFDNYTDNILIDDEIIDVVKADEN